MADLTLWLDSYDDVFSDFDSRHYQKRRISEDFIDEIRQALKYRPESIERLVLHLENAQRKLEAESIIVDSVKEQLQLRRSYTHQKRVNIRNKAVIMLVGGLTLMVADSLQAFRAQGSYFSILGRIILEPAAWFLIWNGLELLLDKYRVASREADFYKLLGQLSIRFKDA